MVSQITGEWRPPVFRIYKHCLVDPKTLRNCLFIAFQVRDLTMSASTVMIVAYILRYFPTIYLDAMKESDKNLLLWQASWAIFEFGTAQV
jgi:hypothetical protein